MVRLQGSPVAGVPQAINLSAACYDSAGPHKLPLPCSNAVKGGEIDISHTSDSGLVVSLSATFKGAPVRLIGTSSSSSSFVPSSAGKLILDATQVPAAGGRTHFAPASPLRLEIYVSDKLEAQPAAVCASLGQPAAEPRFAHLDASEVATVLGNPEPFIVEAHGKDFLAIFATRPVSRRELDRLIGSANDIARHTPAELGVEDNPDPFVVEMKIPHAVAFGDLAQRVSTINFPGLQIQDAGPDKIRITAAKEPSCDQWKTFLDDLKQIVWSLSPEPFVARLYFLQAGQVGAALGSGSSIQSGASITPLQSDLLILGDAHPGDDAAIEEKRRLIASLDLPRPEMIISAWVLQNSSTDPRFVGNFNDIVQRTVAENNDALQQGLFSAWNYLKGQMASPKFFDSLFYGYVVQRFAADLPLETGAIPNLLTDRSDRRLSYSDEPGLNYSLVSARKEFGFCEPNKYCLGYTDIFSLLQPRLTDLLIGVIAASDAKQVALADACALENPPSPETMTVADCLTREDNPHRGVSTKKEHWNRTQTDLAQMLDLTEKIAPDNCETEDLRSLIDDAHERKTDYIKLRCFKGAIKKGLLDSQSNGQISPAGLARAAVADFLFNYKVSQQYPHEFSPYELTHSANDLNSVLRPFVDAFNEDIISYQRYLGARLQVEVNEFNKLHRSWVPWFKDKPFFVNNGIVTVRTISGQTATVDATSQNFLDASSAPQVSDLAQAILGLDQGSSSSTASAAPAPPSTPTSPPETTVTTTTTGPASAAAATPTGIGRLLENLSPNQAQLILAGLSTYQNSKIQIGRDLSLNVTPRSLSGAASAEIAVTLNAADTAPPNYYSGPHAGNAADLSHVAQHSTSTRIRVDSVKMFEVSSFSAVVQRAHSRVPLLPPLVEIPYIGTLIGVPLPPASEYHSSTALLTALSIPTAADLTAGMTFRTDEVVDGDDNAPCVWPGDPVKKGSPCRLRRAISLKDLNDEPISEFHRAMIQCLATDGTATNFKTSRVPDQNVCKNLSFDNVLRNY
ncbi:MAG: hypothetical protein WA324_05140 [Bryobacteraceae bacterium]